VFFKKPGLSGDLSTNKAFSLSENEDTNKAFILSENE
jgi:hypothetical protein